MGRSLLGFSRRSSDCSKRLISSSLMAKIAIRNLTKTYSGGAVVALDNINFEVQPNDVFAFWVRAAAARRRC